jgi:hypothetical protein
MRRTRTALLPLALGIVLLAGTRPAAGQTDARALAGRWDATVTVNGVEVPFAFEITSTSEGPRGTFFNGTRRIASTRGSLENQALVFEYGQYAATLKASVVDGTLTGDYVRGTRAPYPF